MTPPSVHILLADDDPDDRMLLADALAENGSAAELHTVEDGEQLIDYLRRRGQFKKLADTPLPTLILLDLNMPRKDGREALRELKADPQLRRIPVVVLTTSRAVEDIARTYDLGVNSFIIKPSSFQELVEILKTLAQYWFETVKLPNDYTGG
jgi:CheY-like chemotaxis protein